MSVAVREATSVAVSLELLNGQTIRYGPEGVEADDILTGVNWQTDLPGGFSTATLTVPRIDPIVPVNVNLFAGATIYEAETGRTLHEGRISGVNLTEESITFEIEGWSKSLEDDQTCRFLGYDRDLSHWQGMSVQQKLDTIAATVGINDGSVVPDPSSGTPSLALSITGAWAHGVTCEAWYDAHKIPIGAIDYAWKKSSTVDAGDANWSWAVYLYENDVPGGTSSTSGELRAVGPGSGTVAITAVTLDWAQVYTYYGVAGGVASTDYSVFFTLLGVIGRHGLPLQGTVAAPTTGRGLFASDCIRYLVENFSPLTTTPESIEDSSFVIPHAVWLEETTAADIIAQLSVYGGATFLPLDYGCWEDKTFFARSPGTYGTTWRVRLDEGVTTTDQGPDASQRINGVKVRYNPGDGTALSVGPPGSGADTETTDLLDTDPNNPANRIGTRRWLLFDAGVTSSAGATLIGQLILADRNNQEWRGDIQIPGGQVRDEAGNYAPAIAIRAGDRVIVEDSDDVRERRVVSTSSDGTSLSASCGAKPDRLDSLLARLSVVLEGVL